VKKVDKSKLKIIFAEVIKGFSYISVESLGELKVRHLTNLDAAGIDIIRNKYFLKAKRKGLPDLKTRLEELDKEGSWKESDEKSLDEQKSFVSNLYQTKGKLFLERDIQEVQKKIDLAEAKIHRNYLRKSELLGLTCELYADKKISEYYILYSIRNEDGSLYFDSFESVESEIFYSIQEKYAEETSKFNSKNLRRISVSPFFLNFFSLCDKNPQVFYGKPVVDLTFHQAELVTYAKSFINLVENSKHSAPDYLYEDPDALIEFYEGQNNSDKVLDSGEGKDGSTIVGASKTDMEKIGISKDENSKDLAKEAADKGGSLSMQDLMKLHGIK